ncbi:MAG: hypothetical protein SWY16_07740 [Cyanobacteriota bacterium]|nr:hypothetical protein [Cyanobacteriota bacterium]
MLDPVNLDRIGKRRSASCVCFSLLVLLVLNPTRSSFTLPD